MRWGTYKLTEASTARRSAVEPSWGAWWVRFGDEMLLFSADSKWDGVRRAAARSGARVEENDGRVRKSDLHLVVQKGRLFQLEHPDVPVLFDKGRYLVVELDKARATELADRIEPCFSIQPLPENRVVFEQRPRPALRRVQPSPTPLDWVSPLVDRLDRQQILRDLEYLVGLGTRLSGTARYAEAAEWASNRFADLGYDTELQPIDVRGTTSSNVIAWRTGSGNHRELVLAVAHLDSINHAGEAAPGADDNATGSAGVLAIADCLRQQPTINDLCFVLFGGEEQGLFGSQQFLAQLPDEARERIHAVVNMDMIGSLNTATPSVLLEGGEISRPMIEQLIAAAGEFTELEVQAAFQPYSSDHVPFIEAGIPAVLTIEGADGTNRFIHTAQDTLDRVDLTLVEEILRMNVGFLARAAGRSEGQDIPADTAAAHASLAAAAAFRSAEAASYSGRYSFTEGSVAPTTVAANKSPEATSEPSTIHDLEAPIYLPEEPREAQRPEANLRFTLHIDIDGLDPLGVVSGTVRRGPGPARHFIGRVTSDDDATSGRRRLRVEDFALAWPTTNEPVSALEIEIEARSGQTEAEVRFVNASGQANGPYRAARESTFFRQVEVEIDREEGAVNPEPYDTHDHPDRPADLPQRVLTFESAFADAGVEMIRSADSNLVHTSAAGADLRWSQKELHDAMEDNWRAFEKHSQWKMWMFLAQLGPTDTAGGLMFDFSIADVGGVDRQGAALFTKSPYFHTVGGTYAQANPPAEAAVRRELFFNLIHEAGHTFNLLHSFEKSLGSSWPAPAWMPVTTDGQARSWMNYPDSATGSPAVRAFYESFYFRFDEGERLFLRHAPERFVQMGNSAWMANHARVARSSLDHRLRLELRTRKPILELGEPVSIELKLSNLGNDRLRAHRNLNPQDGFVELAITDPRGVRRPFQPFIRTRSFVEPHFLEPGESVYEPVKLAAGVLGLPFKEPGAYRIEASFTNLDGSTAAAVLQVYLRPPASYEELRTIHRLFNARTDRVLYLGGSRAMEDVNEQLTEISGRLEERHPLQFHIREALATVLGSPFKRVDPAARTIQIEDPEPELAQRTLEPVIERMAEAADSLGHIPYEKVVDCYVDCAIQAKKPSAAYKAQSSLVSMFKQRGVVRSAIRLAEERLEKLR